MLDRLTEREIFFNSYNHRTGALYLHYSFAHSRNLLVAIHYRGANFQPELSSLTEVEYIKAKTELLPYLYQNQGFCKLSYAWKD